MTALAYHPAASVALPPSDVERIDDLRKALNRIYGLAHVGASLGEIAFNAQEALDGDTRALGYQDAAQQAEMERTHARGAAHYSAILRSLEAPTFVACDRCDGATPPGTLTHDAAWGLVCPKCAESAAEAAYDRASERRANP